MDTDKLPADCALLGERSEMCLCDDVWDFIRHTLQKRIDALGRMTGMAAGPGTMRGTRHAAPRFNNDKEREMAYEQRPNTAALFRKRDRKNDKMPHYDGKGLLELEDGSTVEIEVAAWERTDKNGNTWYSLSIKPANKDYAANGRRAPQRQLDNANNEDEDIPF